MSLGLNDKMIK